MGKQTGPRFTMAEMLAIFKAQNEGKSLDAASQEILGARATEERFDAAAFQVELDAFVKTLDRKEEIEYFVRAAKLDPQFAKMVDEHQTNIAAIVKWAGANASRIKFYNSAHASVENGNRKHIDPLGANAIARKPIVHEEGFEKREYLKSPDAPTSKALRYLLQWNKLASGKAGNNEIRDARVSLLRESGTTADLAHAQKLIDEKTNVNLDAYLQAGVLVVAPKIAKTA